MIQRASCKIVFTIAFILIWKLLHGQEPKPPEAVDDFGSGLQGGFVTISVLQNDFAEDEHPIKVISAVGSQHADVEFTDSTVTYRPHTSGFMLYPEIDSIQYRIKDLVNGLMSGFAKITITLTPLDFNFSRDTLILNNYEVLFNANGSYFYDYYGDHGLCFEIPAGSGLHTIKRSNLLIGGIRDSYVEHVAGEHDYINGPIPQRHASDFWPGPVSSVYTYSNEYDGLWDKTWKLTREIIQWHKYHWMDAGYQVPEAIDTWPGNGDPEKGQANFLAPFLDPNGNGLYEPLLGDYPAIPGDQVLYSLYNDQRTVGVATLSASLGIEVHQMAYAFDCPGDSIFNNSFFIRYTIINRSAHDFTDLFCGIFTKFNIGTGGDEYMGCDTLLNCYYGYNDSLDEASDKLAGFGDSPPAQGVCFLNHELYGFVGQPETSWNGPGYYYNLLSGLWGPWGEPITVGGDGHGGEDTTTFLFPGDPWDPEQWSDIQVNPAAAGLRKGIGSVGPFDCPSGDMIQLDIAYVFARDYCGTNLSSVALLKERIAQLRWYYENDSTPCGDVWSGTRSKKYKKHTCIVYPNPSSGFIKVDLMERKNVKYTFKIIDLSGKTIMVNELSPTGERINISRLQNGVYIIEFITGSNVIREKFIKK